MGVDNESWLSNASYDDWIAVPVTGQRPAARYKHAAVMIDEKLYVVGGIRNGRYLSDVQVFDFLNLAWSNIKLHSEQDATKPKDDTLLEVLPAISGHNMLKWGTGLLLVAGHSKEVSELVTVRFIDLETHYCGVVETHGEAPVARGGQTVSVVGSKLVVFGGEDRKRRLLNDVHILDLETMTWSELKTRQTPPPPRFDHVAAVHAERYLLIYGGCSHSVFFNDLHVLDLETLEWSQAQMQGDVVSPRAGHAGIAIDENWYIVGGGDNKSGSLDTIVLNLSKLVVTVLLEVQGRHPLASEGLSVSSTVIGSERILVAFGGYNGKYNNEVFVMKPKPKDSLQPKIFLSPAAAAAAASVTAAYALSKSGKLEFTEREDSNFTLVAERDLSSEINSTKKEKELLESSLREVTSENSSLKAKIEETSGTYDELSKEMHSVQGQLVAERLRCSKLEAQIGELQKTLESMQTIEEEVEMLKAQKSAFEYELDLNSKAQRQNSGGVWRWIGG